jgi:hypothetical protein
MLLLLKKTESYLGSAMASLVSLVEKGLNLKYSLHSFFIVTVDFLDYI